MQSQLKNPEDMATNRVHKTKTNKSKRHNKAQDVFGHQYT